VQYRLEITISTGGGGLHLRPGLHHRDNEKSRRGVLFLCLGVREADVIASSEKPTVPCGELPLGRGKRGRRIVLLPGLEEKSLISYTHKKKERRSKFSSIRRRGPAPFHI